MVVPSNRPIISAFFHPLVIIGMPFGEVKKLYMNSLSTEHVVV